LEHLHIFPYSFIYIFLFSALIFYISSFKSKNKIERKVRVLFLIILSILSYFWIERYPLFFNLIKDDSILEYSQFVFYLLAAITSWKIFLIFKKDKNKKIYSILFLLFSVGLFFISFEEISWGQRIIGFNALDSIKEVNLQGETNIHNLFSSKINDMVFVLIGFYGIFSRNIITKFLPKKFKKLVIFTPPRYLSLYFIFLFLAYYDRVFINYYCDTVINNVFRKYIVWEWGEVSELYLAIAFWIYTKVTYRKLINK
jgi:hypothetical protein